MQEGAWQNVVLGADAPRGMEARGTLQQNGPFLHAWLKFRLPGQSQVYMLHASIDLRPFEEALEAEVYARPEVQRAISGDARVGGRIGRKIKEGIKKAAKKVAKSKIVKGIVKVAKKVAKNPLIKGLLSATPFGAAAMAATTAARVAAKAIKGAKKAKQALRRVAAGAAEGDPDAILEARLIKRGLEQLGLLHQVAPRVVAGMDEGAYLAQLVSGCVGPGAPYLATNIPPLVGCGADVDEDQEVEALEEFATAGAFEGVRWLAHRLRPHAMNPNEFGRNDAIWLGHQTMVQRALMH